MMGLVTIRPVSPFSHWPPTTFLPYQHLSQKTAVKLVCSRQSNPRCSWLLRLTRRSRRQSELRSHRTQKTSTWSPASASWTGWRSGRSNHFEQILEKHKKNKPVWFYLKNMNPSKIINICIHRWTYLCTHYIFFQTVKWQIYKYIYLSNLGSFIFTLKCQFTLKIKKKETHQGAPHKMSPLFLQWFWPVPG